MSSLGNLYFNIKFNSDPKELEEMKKKILAQLAELEVKFGISPTFSEEDLVRNINKVLNERFKLNLTVNKEEVSEAINNAVKQTSASTQEAQSVSNQAEAYRDLESAINSIIGTRGQNIKRLTEEKTALASVQSQLKLLEKQQQSGVVLNKDQLKTKSSLINRELEHKQAIAELNQLLRSDVKMTQSAASSMDEMSLKLGRMRTTYRGLSQEMRNSSFGKELKNQINIADKEIKSLDASIGNHQRNVGNYASHWNGLSNSIQQVAREFPSLAYGPKVFFSAISNNLPILSDEIKKARIEYEALKASGQKGVPVWKQIVSSLFSWQTALVAGITLLTLYGGKIVDWIFKTERATKVHDDFIKSLKDGNSEYIEAYKELVRLESLFKNIDGVFITQKDALNEYNNTIGKAIGHTDSLAVAQQNIIDKKEAYLDVVIQEALAHEHLAEAAKLASEEQGLRMKETFKWHEKMWTVLNLKPGAETKQFMDWVSWSGWNQAMAYKNAEKADKLNAKQLKEKENFLKAAKKTSIMAAAAEIDLLPDNLADKKANDPLKERLSLLKEAYNTYREISSLAGKSTALNIVHDTILPGFDPDMYRDEIQKIFDNKSIDAPVRADVARTLIDLDKDVLSNELKETETYIQKTIASWDLFKYLFEKSGDYNFSVNAAFGGDVAYKSVVDQLKTNIEDEVYKMFSDIGGKMNALFGENIGNVDLMSRPMIDAAELVKKGWEDAGEGIATVFSSQFGITDAAGKEREILITPILPNGDVLSPEELEDYVDNVLSGSENILSADYKGIVIGIDVSPDGKVGDELHKLQEQLVAMKEEFSLDKLILMPEIDIKNTFGAQMAAYVKAYKEQNKKITDESLKNAAELLQTYRDYEAKRKDIISKGEKDRADLISAGAGQRAIDEANKRTEQSLASLDFAQFKDTDLWAKVFEDLDRLSTGAIDDIIAKLEEFKSTAGKNLPVNEFKELMNVLKKMRNEYESRNPFKSLITGVKEYRDALTELKKAQQDVATIKAGGKVASSYGVDSTTETETSKTGVTVQKNSVKGIAVQYKSLAQAENEVAEAGDKVKISTDKIKDAFSNAEPYLQIFSSTFGTLSQMFDSMGDTEMADAMDTAQGAMESISNIGQGFAKGGLIGGIGAAVGEAAKWATKAFEAAARHKEALSEIMKETTSQQRAYNLLLKQQNLEYEKASTIFGADDYSKATNAIKVLKEAVADLNTELAGTEDQKNNLYSGFFGGFKELTDINAGLKKTYAGLASIQIKTGHKKTGLFGWGKGKDIYSSVLDVYPELIDANGNFNSSLAETILQTRTMSDENKAALQAMIDYSKVAEDALAEAKDYLTGIFGELGSSISDALVDAFRNGTDAAKAFTDSVTGMLEKMLESMIYAVTLAPIFEKANDDMMEIMKDPNMTDDQKMKAYVGIMDGIIDSSIAVQDEYNGLLGSIKEYAKGKGLDLWAPDDTGGGGLASGIKGVTEDTASLLASYLNATRSDVNQQLQLAKKFVESEFPKISGIAQAQLTQLQSIAANTSRNADAADEIRDFLSRSFDPNKRGFRVS